MDVSISSRENRVAQLYANSRDTTSRGGSWSAKRAAHLVGNTGQDKQSTRQYSGTGSSSSCVICYTRTRSGTREKQNKKWQSSAEQENNQAENSLTLVFVGFLHTTQHNNSKTLNSLGTTCRKEKRRSSLSTKIPFVSFVIVVDYIKNAIRQYSVEILHLLIHHCRERWQSSLYVDVNDSGFLNRVGVSKTRRVPWASQQNDCNKPWPNTGYIYIHTQRMMR